MAEDRKKKTIHKLYPVIKVLFSTAGKRYPLFFVFEALKTLVQVVQPFLGVIVTRIFGYFGWSIVDFRFGKDIRLYDAREMMVERWKKNTEESIAAWKWQADKN